MRDFFEGHPQITKFIHPEHLRRFRATSADRVVIHCHAPHHIKRVILNPDFHVRRPVATLRDPVKSLISRWTRSRNQNALNSVVVGFLSLVQLQDAFFVPIDLDIDRVKLLKDLCHHCELDVNNYVVKTAQEWKPKNSVINETHERLTSIYAVGGLEALAQEIPIPFREIKRHKHILLPFLTKYGYELNW